MPRFKTYLGSSMVKILSIVSLLGFTALSACNTVAGAGEDIQAGGQAIENTAEEVRRSTY
jgi:predicted small secreted protein